MRRKSAFTLMEMIFVIIVLGIVAGGTFIQISSIYEQLLQKQGSSELENESKVIIEQIAARISSATKGSLVATDSLNTNDDCKAVSALTSSDNNNILVWVAKSDESNTGLWDEDVGDYRGWSGFVDVNRSNETIIYTRGSNLDNANIVIKDLTGGDLSANAAIYFAPEGLNQSENVCKIFYGDYMTESHMYKVKYDGTNKDQLQKNDKDFANISEQYTLSHAAYAIKREDNGELYLYEFRPWNSGEGLSSSSKKYLLGKNVSGFGFRWEGGIFRINVCLQKQMVGDYNISICKEKAIF